jgi:hypothetical protein
VEIKRRKKKKKDKMLRVLSKKDNRKLEKLKPISLEETIERFRKEPCRTCNKATYFEYGKSVIEGQDFWRIKNYMADYYYCIDCGQEKRYYTGLK